MLGIPKDVSLELEVEDFDDSLGCPLDKYENATPAMVGGKALNCWRLMKHGFPVPNSFIVPTYVYSMHIGKAGVVGLIADLFSKLGETSRDESEKKLDEIRDKILSTALDEEVVRNIKTFLGALPATSSVAVRSSGSAEDMLSQSFAGQYDTFLYKKTLEEVVDSIKACWASMFKVHILDYALRPVFQGPEVDGKHSNNDMEPSTVHQLISPPKMGVLIMQMVDSAKSGVCFTRNLWGEANEIMVESVYGQCEGLVSGEVTPDRFVVDKYSMNVVYQQNVEQTHMFVRSSNRDGVEKVSLDENEGAAKNAGSVLSSSDLRVSLGRTRLFRCLLLISMANYINPTP